MAMLAHLASAILSLLSFASASILAPLVMWFIYKDKPGYSFTKEASRRAFNFNFSLWVISMASWLLIILTFGILGIILWVVPMVVAILMVIFHSLAALAANRGEAVHLPDDLHRDHQVVFIAHTGSAPSKYRMGALPCPAEAHRHRIRHAYRPVTRDLKGRARYH